MASYPGIVTGTEVNHKSSLRIYCDEEKEGPFVIHPIGGIDADTSPLLQKEFDRIAAAAPQFVVFDMQYVHYINTCGLIVILNACKVVEQQGGRVGLMNMQPQIKKVFDIVNTLPRQQIFTDRLELDQYLDAMQSKHSGTIQTEAEIGYPIVWAERLTPGEGILSPCC
jgi:anti-anti-sigma factor